MSSGSADDLVLLLGLFGGFLLLICVAGFLADYVAPRIPSLERWIANLTALDEDEELEEPEMPKMIVIFCNHVSSWKEKIKFRKGAQK